jgi:hypothetical protein
MNSYEFGGNDLCFGYYELALFYVGNQLAIKLTGNCIYLAAHYIYDCSDVNSWGLFNLMCEQLLT